MTAAACARAALAALMLAAPAHAQDAGEAQSLDPMLERAARILITECHPDAATLVRDPSKDRVVGGNVFAQRLDATCPDSDASIVIICFVQLGGPRAPECLRR
jgi:hypothetical protein